MQRTDLEAPITEGLHSAAGLFPAPLRLGLCAVAIFTCATLGALQCSAQDVAEAARQERARKEALNKKPKRVYTEEDLKRAQILTSQDRAELEAKKNQQPSPEAGRTEEALDVLAPSPNAPHSSLNVTATTLKQDGSSNALPSGAPLGDVARYYRRQKVSQALRREQEFPLSLPNAPALASPKAMQPLDPSLPQADSATPRFNLSQPLVHPSKSSRPIFKSVPPQVGPFQRRVKRSPFARPKFFPADSSRVLSSRSAPPSPPTQPPAAPAAPAKPSKPFVLGNSSKAILPSKPSGPPAHRNPPVFVTPAILANALPSAPTAVPFAPVKPSSSTARIARTNPAALLVQPGDSLWKLAAKHLGQGLRWREFLAVNPSIHDANHIEASSQILLPAAASSTRTGNTLTVQKGDSLSKIARAHLGHSSAWRCIAHANPTVIHANLIYPGQTLLLPAACERVDSQK